jgi:glycerol-3-phosphate acyltransferase PlsX
MPSIRIAIDASGGDYAPSEIIAGAIDGARQHSVELILVGRSEQIDEQLLKHDTKGLAIEIVDAPELIEMQEDPALTVRKKTNSSIVVGCELVRDQRADAIISMGHTGAAMIAGLFTFGRLPGIDRPAALAPFLGFKDTFVLDVGANTEVQPKNLLQFAIMGSIYVERVMEIPNPKVGLLSNGGEPNKGNAIGKQTYPLLAASKLNFVGNIEGHGVVQHEANVIVSDGFAGNIALKLGEDLIAEVLNQVEQEAAPIDDKLRSVLAKLREQHDYARIGAAPILGVNGLLFIGHGRSKAPAVVSAIGLAVKSIESKLLEAIVEGLKGS